MQRSSRKACVPESDKHIRTRNHDKSPRKVKLMCHSLSDPRGAGQLRETPFPTPDPPQREKPSQFAKALAIHTLRWLRGVDLNHRPLGYEFKGKLIRIARVQGHRMAITSV